MRRRARYWFGVMNEAMRRFTDDDHAVYAGHMAFTLLMSLGPFIICAIILAQQIDAAAADHLIALIESLRDGSLIPVPMAKLLIQLVQGVAPDAEATQLTSGDWWRVAILAGIGLYSGSSAFEAARNGFNEAYDTRDRRHFIFRRFQSHLLALAIATLFVITSAVFITAAFSIGATAANIANTGFMRLVFLGLIVAVVIFMFWMLLLGVHVTLPRGYVKRWHLYVWAQDEIDDIRAVRVPLKPGVRITTVAWMLFAVAYSYVLGGLINFDANHGALAGVVATLIFFYVSSALIFFGAQINIAIATVGPDGAPAWPHPSIPRQVGFDESKLDAYRVLTHTRPRRSLTNRVLHVCRGGTACERPEEVVSDAIQLRDKQRALEALAREARLNGALTPDGVEPSFLERKDEQGATV